MANAISKADIADLDFVDALELAATESTSDNYLTRAVVSTTSGTKTVVVTIPPGDEGLTGRDFPVEVGDLAIITGTSGGLGNGTFTVATVVDDTSFTVLEAIGTSTGGSVTFRYSAGTKKIGINPTGLIHSTSNVLDGVVRDLDAAITGGIDFNKFLLEVSGAIVYIGDGEFVLKV
jgi:hypothetical protein